jgi:AraC-like DNA-binding protein
MLVRATLKEFFDAPVGKVYADRTCLHFCAGTDLVGCVLWGRPNADDLAHMLEFADAVLERFPLPHASLFDVRRLDGFDAPSYPVLARYLATRGAALRAGLTRVAVLAEGWLGATAEGIPALLGVPCATRTFTSPTEALAWLGAEPSLLEWLDEAFASSTDALLARLRVFLEGERAGVDEAARALGVSPRTLQRLLRAHGTTFRAEASSARIRAAQALLSSTDAPVTEIAFEVGCASSQHFSVLFRRATGRSPSEWRERARSS